jgi:hypothetical protein
MPGSGLARCGVAVDVLIAVAIATFRYSHASAGQRHAEGILPSLALGLLFASPGLLATVGIRIARPVLCGFAAITCVPLTIVSIAAFPMLLPAALFAASFVQASNRVATPPKTTVVAGAMFVTLTVAALEVWLMGWGGYTYVFPGGGESGEYILPAHAVFTILLVGANVASSTFLARCENLRRTRSDVGA